MMGRSGVVCLNILILSFLVWSHAIEAGRLDISKEEDMEIDRQLKMLNKPYVKSFKDNYGNTYDCIDIHKQPAFDHPLLKNHTIQMKPSSCMRNKVNKPSKRGKLYNFGFKEGCPAGTVLIRRTRKEDLIRAKKIPQYLQPHLQYDDGTYADTVTEYHRASILIDGGSDTKYYGASASFEVHELPRVLIDQATGAQVVLLKGERGPKKYLNGIHFGWQTFYLEEHDANSHFFTYWTTDGYQHSGCFDMLCAGFVQVSKGTTPGIVIPEGQMEFSVSRDRSTGNWLLQFVDNDNELIGYWPKELFNNMADNSQVQVMGTAYSPKDVVSPPMGSGYLPTKFGKAAKFRRVRLMNGNGDFFPPASRKVTTFVDLDPQFYGVGYEGNYGGTEGYSFKYGGPGGWQK